LNLSKQQGIGADITHVKSTRVILTDVSIFNLALIMKAP